MADLRTVFETQNTEDIVRVASEYDKDFSQKYEAAGRAQREPTIGDTLQDLQGDPEEVVREFDGMIEEELAYPEGRGGSIEDEVQRRVAEANSNPSQMDQDIYDLFGLEPEPTFRENLQGLKETFGEMEAENSRPMTRRIDRGPEVQDPSSAIPTRGWKSMEEFLNQPNNPRP